MRRLIAVLGVGLMVGFAACAHPRPVAMPGLAPTFNPPCAVVVGIDAAGIVRLPALARCEAGKVFPVIVCNDSATPHTVQVADTMRHKRRQKDFKILRDGISVSVAAKTSDATAPVCALGAQPFLPDTEFKDGDDTKPPYGKYKYNVRVDTRNFDPDVDVRRP